MYLSEDMFFSSKTDCNRKFIDDLVRTAHLDALQRGKPCILRNLMEF